MERCSIFGFNDYFFTTPLFTITEPSGDSFDILPEAGSDSKLPTIVNFSIRPVFSVLLPAISLRYTIVTVFLSCYFSFL